MAVSINLDQTSLPQIAKVLGLEGDKPQALHNAGVKLGSTPKSLTLSYKGQVIAYANANLSAVMLAMKGKLAGASKEVLKSHLEGAMDKAHDHLDNAGVFENTKSVAQLEAMSVNDLVSAMYKMGGFPAESCEGMKYDFYLYIGISPAHVENKVAAIKFIRLLYGLSLMDAKYLVEQKKKLVLYSAQLPLAAKLLGSSPSFTSMNLLDVSTGKSLTQNGWVDASGFVPLSLHEGNFQEVSDTPIKPAKKKAGSSVTGSKPVKLRDATKLLQPVLGSSPGSIYYAVALSDVCKVAARLRSNGSVSIRAEGDNLKKFVTQLKNAGLTMTDKGHFSVHFDGLDEVMARKVVGAVLFSTAINFTEVASDLTAIYGKGK